MGTQGYLMIILIVLAALFILLSVHLSLQVRKLEKRIRRFMKGRDGLSLEEAFADRFDELDELHASGKRLRGDFTELRNIEKKSFTKYGVVKYDAFEDVVRRLRFVLALLNEEDTGIVLNAIHSKDNCFLYLKEIVGGESYIMLSDEEIRALQAAKKFDNSEDLDSIMSTINTAGASETAVPLPPDEGDGEEVLVPEEEMLDSEDSEAELEEMDENLPIEEGREEE